MQDMVNIRDRHDLSAMDYAVERRHDEVATLIQSKGGGLTGEELRLGLMHAVESLDLEEFTRYRHVVYVVTGDDRSCLPTFEIVTPSRKPR